MSGQARTRTFAFAEREETRARLFADVALNRPVRREFTYAVPDALAARVVPGSRVAVPLGRTREIGIVVALHPDTALDRTRVKPLAALLDDEPLIDAELLELSRWLASYYGCALGEALSALLPAPLKHETQARTVSMVFALPAAAGEALAALERSHPKHHRVLRTLIDAKAKVELRELCRRVQLSPAFVHTLVKKGLVGLEKVVASLDPFEGARDSSVRVRPEQLSAEQAQALADITAPLARREYATCLLQGVTGSGKTEVYLRAIEAALDAGRGAIVIVPEIALTPQTVGWFRSRFAGVAVLHSRMTDAQRRSTWLSVQRGEARVVVGARSAVFAPVRELGVIVVDEEHEPSFKQGENPRYHARDVAVMRARNAKAVCILGSATPSLESWSNAKSGRYRHSILRGRVSGGRLPEVEIVDVKLEKPDDKSGVLFSRRLCELLKGALERGEQSILFLNRRGFAPVLWCAACGETVRCRQCDVALTFHKRIGRAVCHSCAEEITPPKQCPSCTAPKLRYFGAGSERVEGAIAKFLPTARIARMDSDTMLRREDYEDVLARFGKHELDVLVGTQMIAKGLDFPRVTVVGIVSADSSLHQPDFRAAERTFQLVAQVAGRAGRGALPGRIVVQTSSPSHPAITFAAKHDFEGFAAVENRLRQELGYPPFGRLMRIVFEDVELARVERGSHACVEALRTAAEAEGVALLGPAEAPIARLRGKHRRHVLIKAKASGQGLPRLRNMLLDWIDANPRPRTTLDVDPVAML